MNEKEARSQGLEFHGAFANPQDEEKVKYLKATVAEIKKGGFRAIIVQSGMNEWGGGSKLIYVDPLFMQWKWLQEHRHINYIAQAEKKCAEIMVQARERQARQEADIARVEAKLAAHNAN